MNELFLEYFNELEGFTLRAERFYDDASIVDEDYRLRVMRKWLESAFYAGYESALKNKVELE